MQRDIAELWLDYNRARRELSKALGRDDDLVTDVGGKVIAEAYGATTNSSGAYKPIYLADGRTVETRAARRCQPGPIQLAEIKDWDFDVLAIVVFDEEGYVESASEIAVAQVREIAKYDSCATSAIRSTASTTVDSHGKPMMRSRMQETRASESTRSAS